MIVQNAVNFVHFHLHSPGYIYTNMTLLFTNVLPLFNSYDKGIYTNKIRQERERALTEKEEDTRTSMYVDL